ncbi:MAG: DegV family protein [Anaerolineae bacterium]|nr:DegV family protein [Anaerolineae bacterium]
MRVAVVADSTCDLPAALCERYGIRIIPVTINFGTESYPDDGQSLPRSVFYARFVRYDPLPTTAAFSVGQAEAVFREALAEADHVIAVHIPRSISSLIESAQQAAAQIGNRQVTVFDTGSLSMGAGWLALIAGELAAAGKAPADILGALEDARARLRVWAGLDTLEHLRRSGRDRSPAV